MSDELKPEYRVGQEVLVSYYARVAEVGAGHPQREGRVIRLETTAIPTGWIDPASEGLTVTIVSSPLPTEPGMYWQMDASGKQGEMGDHHTDGKEFHYLNGQGVWVDVGFGFPTNDEPIYPLVQTPF